MDPVADSAARLARWCVRKSSAPLRWQRLASFGLLVLTTVACACWAVALRHSQTIPPPGWSGALDYAYAPFLYLVPQTSLAFAADLTLPDAIARLTGPLIPVLGAVALVRRWMLTSVADYLIDHRARGHAVILSDSGHGDALALASAQAGEVVVLADPALMDEADRLAALGVAGVICRGALPMSLERAGTVVLWQPGDADNIASATALRADQTLGTGEIHLSIRSVDLQRALLQVPDLMLDKSIRLRPHSPAGDAMRAALAGPQMAERALEQGKPRVALCLWGASDAIQWAAEIALRQFWTVQLAAPRIMLAGLPDDTATPEALLHLAEHAAEVFGAGDACPVIERLSADAARDEADITCHLVDAGQPDATLEQAFALASRLRQAHDRPAPVWPVLDVACAIEPLFATDKLVFLPPVIPAAGLTVATLRNREADRAAAEIHLAYDRQFGGGGSAPASGRWQDLPETYVAANRAAADHLAIKQWDAATSGLEGDALTERLAQAEHNRWSADRLLSGWAPSGAGARDNVRRLHPDLRPWGALSEEAREKDRAGAKRAVPHLPMDGR